MSDRPNEGAARIDSHVRWGTRKLGLWVFRFGPVYGRDEWNVTVFLGPIVLTIKLTPRSGRDSQSTERDK